jgi:hypothetical protein
VHIIEIFEIAYGSSCKLRSRTWYRIVEEVKLFLPKTGRMISMP